MQAGKHAACVPPLSRMNTFFSSFCRILLLIVAPLSLTAAEYSISVGTISSSLEWTNPATWLSDSPDPYPNSAADKIYFGVPSQNLGVRVNQELIEVGEVVTEGDSAVTRAFYGAAGMNTTLKVGTFNHLGGGLVNFRNSAQQAKLSVEIGNLTVGASSSLEIGQAYQPGNTSLTLEAFTVTGTTTNSGIIRYDGVKERAEGQNIIQLGHLEMSGVGNLALGGRSNNDGVVEVRSLSGSVDTRIYVYRTGAAYGGLRGTLAIHSEEGTSATYQGHLRDTYNDDQQAEGASLTVRMTGAGTQIFSGANNKYSGGTVIEGGVLAVANGSGSGLGYGKVVVTGSGTLAGSGRIALVNETIEVQSGGTLFPSAHLASGGATLQINGANVLSGPLLTLHSGATLRFRLGADLVYFTNWHEGGLQLAESGVIIEGVGITEGQFNLFRFDTITAEQLSSLVAQLNAQTLGESFNGWNATFGYSTEGNRYIWVNVVAVPEGGVGASLMTVLLAGGLWRSLSRRRPVLR